MNIKKQVITKGTLRDDDGKELMTLPPGRTVYWDGTTKETKNWLEKKNTYYFVRLLDGEGQVVTTEARGWFHEGKLNK
jgi:hypothetical protein